MPLVIPNYVREFIRTETLGRRREVTAKQLYRADSGSDLAWDTLSTLAKGSWTPLILFGDTVACLLPVSFTKKNRKFSFENGIIW